MGWMGGGGGLQGKLSEKRGVGEQRMGRTIQEECCPTGENFRGWGGGGATGKMSRKEVFLVLQQEGNI